jgi:hypothetical protein
LVIDALQDAGLNWSFASSTHPLLVKMLLCGSATESNANREVGSGFDPTLGRAATPKDRFEGYGMINPDAAIEAASLLYAGGVLSDSSAGGHFDRRAWGRRMSLTSGSPLSLTLVVPSIADYDLYLYRGTPDMKGNPIILASSTNAGLDADEAIAFTPSATETAYLFVKRVSGSGSWLLSGTLGTTTSTTSTSSPTSTSPSTSTSTTTSTLPASFCAPMPGSGCRLGEPLKSSIRLKDDGDDTKDQFKWKWNRGAATSVSDFADPVNGSAAYRVCLYDSSGKPQPLREVALAPGGTCGTTACWRLLGNITLPKGYSYRNRLGNADGLTDASLQAGLASKAKLQVRGKGVNLAMPALGLSLPVTAQLLIDDGMTVQCWQTTFSTFQINTSAQFRAKGP